MKQIKFDREIIDLDTVLKIGFTYTGYNALSKIDEDTMSVIEAFSKLDRIIVVPYKENLYFNIHTQWGNFFCKENEEYNTGFTVMDFYEKNLKAQTDALKNGIIFKLHKGIEADLLLVKREICLKYINGISYDYNEEIEVGDTKASMNALLNELKKYNRNRSNSYQDRADEVEEAEVEEDAATYFMKETLEKAEQYSILTSELEEKRIHEKGRVAYHSVHAVEFDRVDRIAYGFMVEDVDITVFKEGVQIEIEGNQTERINGEIISIDSSDKMNIEIVILFNMMCDFGEIKDMGFISLSFSTVNRDVQLTANEKIVNGTSKAKYFKDILGKNASQGFEEKDLTEVKDALSKVKYPPNQSQMTAIEQGIKSKDIFLVMGPPGTGKTTVILEWVKYFVNVEHKRVLVSSQNNKAVDNVLERLIEEDNIDILRLGSEAKLQPKVVPCMYENKIKDLNQEIDESTKYSINKLEYGISVWQEYRNRYQEFIEILDKIEKRKEQLVDEIKSQLISIRRLRKAKYKEYLEALEGKRKGNKSVDLSYIKSEYNRISAAYLQQEGSLRTRFIRDISRIDSRLEEKRKEFKSERPILKLPGGGFKSVRPTKDIWKSKFQLEKFVAVLDKELYRQKRILNAQKIWREETIGVQNYALGELVLGSVDLVGATCIGVASQAKFANINFDVTIIDEAGQIQIHNALVPMSVSNKVIMLGDYKQIPPTADQDLIDVCRSNGVDTTLIDNSLFQELYEEFPNENKLMLDTQYRMPGDIADIISDWFYKGEYKSFSLNRKIKSIVPRLSDKPFIIIDTSKVEGRGETRTAERGTFNKLEAKICGDIVAKVLSEKEIEQRIEVDEIGVISAYKDQVNKMKRAVGKMVGEEQAKAMVATLDSFQGQERKLILYSFTKSSNKPAERSRIGFLNELRRLNVAMSRCKKTLIMVGDMDFLKGCLHQPLDDYDRPVYSQSEKEFSDFIKTMVTSVENGKGELISYQTFLERMGD